MRHIFTTNKRENFAKNTSTPITVFLLLKKVSRLVGIYLKKLGRKSLFNTSATVPPYKSIDDIAVDNDTDEKHVYVSQANEFHQLFHVKAKLAPDTGSTVMHSTTSTKTYQIASTYNEQTRQWVPCLTNSDPIQEKSYREDDPPLNSSFFRGVATVILLILFSVSGVSANRFATVDLSLRSVVNNSNPTLGASIKYTLWLKNEGTTTANTIIVKNNFPISGATLTANTGGANFTYVAGTGVGTWNVATLAAGDSVSLELTGTVKQRGAYFNIAEINSISSGDTDSDSTPGNNNLSEDDITTACISIPLLIYPGEQYTVFVPSAYKSSTAIQWFRNGVLITSSTPEATVNSDTSLVIKAIGNYTFNTGTTSACGPQGCCPIQVVAGPYGSIGDLVWKDKNDNGIQESGEPGIKNIIVELYTMNGSGQVSATPVSKDTTDNSGHYLFTGLLSGDYVVKIPTSNLSDTLKISKKKDVGSDDTKDNDFNASTGFSTKITIHVDSIGNKKDNLTVDAALYTPMGSIGGLAWNDGNNDGIRGDIEIGVNNVVVELYSADAVGNPLGAALARDTTNVDGIYRFTNLVKGAYVVKVLANTLPEGSVVSSKKNLGGDIRKDNDFNNTTGLSGRIVLDPENDTANPLNKDNYTIDVAVFNPLGSIGDFVWRDADNDGIQDIDEVGIKGVRLRLYAANTDGTPTGNALKTDTTDAHGYYLFSNLVLGDYVVAIDKTSLPTGAILSTMVSKGSNDRIDSDFNATTGYSGKISIDPTVQTKKDILSIDAAVYLTCPTLTVSTTDNEICVGDSIFIKGVTSNNASVKWYLSAINGTPSFTTSSNTNHLVFPTTTTTYYAEIDGSHPSCPNLRQPVTIVVNARPSLPACSCVIDECANKTVNLNDYVINGATTPGGIFQWRTTASEKSPLVANPSAVNAGVYYLFEKSGAGCFSPPRMVTVNHKNCDTLIDLSLTKIVSKAAPKLWETIIYSIKVTNAGPHAATNVEVEDQMPTDLEFLSSSFFTKNGNILTAKISNIAAGQTITLDYLARPRTLGEKINFAQITKADQKDIDSTPGNASTTQEDDNSKVIISPIQEEVFADLSLDKTVNKSAATTGEQITFYVTVLNDGSSQATNVEVRDIVPDGLQVLNATGGDSISISGNTVTAKFKTIGVGFASTFQIVARVTATSGTIKNWAQITKSDQKDNDSTPGNGTGNGEDDTDFADVTISAGVCNPPTPLIATSTPHICSGESVTLTSIGCTGTVVWSTGATGNTLTVTPTVTTTYTAKCKITDTCISGDANPVVINLNVITPPLITSNVPGNTICAGGSVTLTASSCSGSVIWSNNTTASSITVSPTATTNYTAVCKTNSCTSSPSSPISITVGTTGGTAPTITASKNTICNGETVVLTASGCTGTLTWSNAMTGTSISIKPTTSGTYSATCASSACGSRTSTPVTITVTPGIQTPVITANRDTVCAGGNVNLTVSNCTGTLSWSTGVSSSVIAVSPAATTTYEVTCTSGQCSAKASKSITVKPQPAAPVITSAKTQICAGESVVLTANNCEGTVNWSTGATTATITVNPIITTSYTATCNVNGCNSVISAPVSVTVAAGAAPTITASKDSICVGGSSVLTVAGCTGTLLWSNGQTTSSITVNPTATLTYTVTCKTATCETSASKVIRVSNQTIVAPVISASNTNLCTAGNVTLTASGCTGSTVIWSNLQTGTSITVNVTTNIVYAAACKIGDCESEKSNNINITVGTLTKPVISTTQSTICTGSSTILSSTGCNGQVIWSNGLTGSSVTVNPVTTTEYTAVCKALQGECTSDQSNKLQVTVTSQLAAPTITTTSATICKTDTITLSAAGCAGTFTWSSGQTSSSIVVSPDTTTSYTVKCKLGTCESAASAVTTITVGIPTAPVISAKKTQICGGNTTQLEATGCIGSVKWSDGQIGAFISVSPGTTTTYTAVCNVGKCESVKSNAVTIQVTSSALAKPVTKDLVNTCPFTQVDLTTGVTSTISSVGGTFTFRRVNNPDSSTVANPSAVSTGTYYVFEKAGNGCFSEGSRINVQIINCNDTISCVTSPAMVNAGKDTTICVKTDFFTLNGKKSGAAQSTRWKTDGTGTFDNSLSLTARYSYSNQDITRGFVNFVLTSNDPDGNGPCKAAVDTVKLTLNGISGVPTITSNKAPNICGRDSVILTITQANARVWSTGDTTRSIVVKNSGTYSVRYRNAQGCTSLSSNAITVVANDTIVPPTVLAVAKNVCPAKTVNLSTAVTSSPRTAGGVFEFRTGATVTSSLVTTPTAVGAGTYYVFEKSAIGCYSRSSPILVRIDSCSTPPADTVKAELGITIVGSRTEGQIGDVLTYTITVTNNTIKTATNVHITNVLPRGLTITSTTPGLTPFGTDSLISVIGTFPGGAVKTYTYTAKTTKAGIIRNIVKITKLDQVDPILSNNSSYWDVRCLSCQETCVGVALAADTVRQANGSYNVAFRAFLESCGNVKLENVKITENLATMFPSPVTFTIVQKPTVGVGSKIIPNPNFNGSTDLNLTIPTGSILEQNIIDTVKFVINIVPNGNQGPFSTNARVDAVGNTAFGLAQEVSDISNNGVYIDKPSAEPTVVRLFKSPSIGLAKIVSDSTKKTNGSYDVTYRLFVKNNGSLPLTNVVLTDTLSKVFKLPATFTVSGAPIKNAGSQLVVNTAFNGSTDTRLTLPASTIPVGQTDTLDFKVNLLPDTIKLFANTAVVNARGTLASGTNQDIRELSNAGTNPDVPGNNPTILNLDQGGGMGSIEIPCIGVVLSVKDTVKQADGTYNIVFQSVIQNCGNLTLSNVQLCDTLANTFPASLEPKIVQQPTVNAGSQLVATTNYDGVTNTCLLASSSVLAAGKADTVKWTVNIKLGPDRGRFTNSVVVSGRTPAGLLISNTSSTVINFSAIPEASIGISKEASKPIKVSGNTYDVTFKFNVKNYGRTALTNIQVQDNLSATFGDSVRIDSVRVTADAGFTVNSNYTGRGSLINLLVDSLSTLPVNATRSITLFTRITLAEDINSFANQALAIGKYPTNKTVDDLSTDGPDPDPDGDGNPKNNSISTPIVIDTFVADTLTVLGIAKEAILDTIPNADDSYNLTYRFVIKNYSTRTLKNIQLRDSLGQVFADSSNFIIAAPITLSAGSTLKLNGEFNGRTTATMLIADSSSLAPGKADTLEMKLRIVTDKKQTAVFANSAYGSARDSSATVTDISHTGKDPDPDGDGNPGNNNAPTLITLSGDDPTNPVDTTTTAIIPGGFSPNGDGVGDKFFIKNINKTNIKASIYIYNRWGALVYKNEDFGKSDGWDAKANNGILIMSDGKAVPDGTYYYVIQAEGKWAGKPQIGFITIAR